MADQPELKIAAPNAESQDHGVAFFPDLCSIQAVLFIVLGTELLALVITLLQGPLQQFSWPTLGQVSMLSLWISLCTAGILCQARHWLGRIPTALAGGLSYATVLVVALVFTAAGQWLVVRSVDWFEVAKVMIVTAIVAGVVLRYIYLQQQLTNQQQASNRAHINALQARIRPHFLFNSLNAVVSLIGFDQKRAERVVLDLCDLFRASIAEPALVPMAKEIALAEQYLAIEALRLDRRLRVTWNIQGDMAQCWIPSMILQPLLENAVFHGIEPRRDGGEIVIDVHNVSGDVELTITNPLSERSSDRVSNGVAQDNIRARLQAHFGTRVTFTAGPDDERYRVHLSYRADDATPH